MFDGFQWHTCSADPFTLLYMSWLQMKEEKDEGEKLSLKTVPLLRNSFYFYVSGTSTTRSSQFEC